MHFAFDVCGVDLQKPGAQRAAVRRGIQRRWNIEHCPAAAFTFAVQADSRAGAGNKNARSEIRIGGKLQMKFHGLCIPDLAVAATDHASAVG